MSPRAAVLLIGLLFSPAAFGQCADALHYSGEFRATMTSIAVDGSRLWLATGYGVSLYDRTTDPPAFVTSSPLPGVTRVVRTGAMGVTYAASGTAIDAVRFDGHRIVTAGSVDAGAAVNDLLVSGNDVYAATDAGLIQFDVSDPAHPVRTTASLPTSNASVRSLAFTAPYLFVADGDSSIEVFSLLTPSQPQPAPAIASLGHSVAVHTIDDRLYVTDGLSTDVFLAASGTYGRVANVKNGSLALAEASPGILFTAGDELSIHAFDWTLTADPVELFSVGIAPTGGTVNRAVEIEVVGNRVYAAAGDAGLLTFDISTFGAPFPVRSYTLSTINPATGNSVPDHGTSTLWLDQKLYVSRASGGIEEFVPSSSGHLTTSRQWDSSVDQIFDGANGFLLSSSGGTLTEWTLFSFTPVVTMKATFSATIASAVLDGNKAVVVLTDGTVWTTDLTLATPDPAAVPGVSADQVTRSGAAVLFSKVGSDGSTRLSYYSNGDLTATPSTITIAGGSTAGLAMQGSRVAVFTYLGVSVADFSNGSVVTLPNSNDVEATALALTDTELLEVTNNALRVWDLSAGTVARTFPIPASATSLSVESLAAAATSNGVLTVAYDSAPSFPTSIPSPDANVYYRKALAAGDRLDLFDGRKIDIFSTSVGFAPHFINTIREPGTIDFAITADRVFTLSGAGVVSSFTRDGQFLAQATLNEGSDAQPLAIVSAGDAAWVSLSRGCLSGGCEKKTVVFDGSTLVASDVLDGGVTDAAVLDGVAYAIFDLPSEIRSYEVGSDPSHPQPLHDVPAPGSKPPVSIAAAPGSVYVLGDRLYTLSAASLAQTSADLTPYVADSSSGVSFVDQRIRVNGTCAFVSGRSFDPLLFTTGVWTNGRTLAVPAAVRSVAQVNGTLFLLTDDSVEVWSSEVPVSIGRHRSQ